jgi:hypothetical protein
LEKSKDLSQDSAISRPKQKIVIWLLSLGIFTEMLQELKEKEISICERGEKTKCDSLLEMRILWAQLLELSSEASRFLRA